MVARRRTILKNTSLDNISALSLGYFQLGPRKVALMQITTTPILYLPVRKILQSRIVCILKSLLQLRMNKIETCGCLQNYSHFKPMFAMTVARPFPFPNYNTGLELLELSSQQKS